MENENMQVNSDVGTEVSSEPQQPVTEQTDTAPAAPVETKPKEADLPFHEHPRFRELVEQKNKALESNKTLEKQLKELSERVQSLSSPKEQDALIARLKSIDPEFGTRFEKLDSVHRELNELREWRNQMQVETVRTTAVNTIKSLHEANKVPAELQDLYNEQLEAAYSRNPNEFLGNVQSAYKAIHDRFSKLLDGIKRSERETYTSEKKQVAKVPTPQKGKSVAPKASEYSNDPAVARQQLVSRILKQSRESNSV